MLSSTLMRACLATSIVLAWSGIGSLSLLGSHNAAAGEIILAPQKAESGASASEQRYRAKAYQRDDTPVVIVPQEEVEGILSPRQSRPETRARENRLRAGERRGDQDTSGSIIVIPGSVAPPATIGTDSGSAREKARDNRARAAAYSRGGSDTTLTGRAGADGTPTVVCKDVDNVAGRIGDDVKSGSVIIVMRDGKPLKVRCQ